MKYLPVHVLTSANGSDCSNHGVTFTHSSKLVVPCADGFLTDEDCETRGYIRLIPGEILGCKNFKPETVGKRHSMFGGNFVYTSDSRYRNEYGHQPIQVHDRVEG